MYFLVANRMRTLVATVSSGFESALGDMIAKNEKKTLKKSIEIYEVVLHFIGSIVFSVGLLMITPFILIYTKGVNDVNYARYVFGYVIVASELLFCLRTPYEAVINAAGHFSQTKKYAFIESLINIIVSAVLFRRYGIIGLTIGTLLSVVYKNLVFANYISRNIVQGCFSSMLKRFTTTAINILCVVLIGRRMMFKCILTLEQWVLNSVCITLVSITVTLIFNWIS